MNVFKCDEEIMIHPTKWTNFQEYTQMLEEQQPVKVATSKMVHTDVIGYSKMCDWLQQICVIGYSKHV